ncbi:M15 family metallopeptidase [uncultured Lamprocystis sp.]|jgi:peptidoglycan L-alanyl-D-glutamate endopeptidase CwlK|uniref:M15 family metallopeptidase n=1 Tax=uncultured Lamprocystis sp. TaxID=543132 RepID=UPI0025D533B1|nr:M15 family metallopeptidase [uncultured Lamprocystis sp.]
MNTVPFVLSAASRQRLKGVHPDLIRIVERAITLTPVDFKITDGVRSPVGWGDDGTPPSPAAARWGSFVTPTYPLYGRIAVAMKQAAKDLSLPLVWGGDWKSFKDGPHFELPANHYPEPRHG